MRRFEGRERRRDGGWITYFGNHFDLFFFLAFAYIIAVVFASSAARELPNEPPPC